MQVVLQEKQAAEQGSSTGDLKEGVDTSEQEGVLDFDDARDDTPVDALEQSGSLDFLAPKSREESSPNQTQPAVGFAGGELTQGDIERAVLVVLVREFGPRVEDAKRRLSSLETRIIGRIAEERNEAHKEFVRYQGEYASLFEQAIEVLAQMRSAVATALEAIRGEHDAAFQKAVFEALKTPEIVAFIKARTQSQVNMRVIDGGKGKGTPGQEEYRRLVGDPSGSEDATRLNTVIPEEFEETPRSFKKARDARVQQLPRPVAEQSSVRHIPRHKRGLWFRGLALAVFLGFVFMGIYHLASNETASNTVPDQEAVHQTTKDLTADERVGESTTRTCATDVHVRVASLTALSKEERHEMATRVTGTVCDSGNEP